MSFLLKIPFFVAGFLLALADDLCNAYDVFDFEDA